MTKTILLHDDVQVGEMSEEHRKKGIMDEGYPLQRFCAKKLQNLGWQVFEEYPVEQPIPVAHHPYGGVAGQFKEVRTSGDIRAIHQYLTKGFSVCVCVSCKKQSEIDWVFMKEMFTENVHKMITAKKGERNVYDYVFDLKHELDENYPLCNIPTHLYDKKGKKEENMIVKTSENLYLETLQTFDDHRIWLQDHAPYSQIIYIPVIVTGAKIHVYDIDENNFDISKTDSINIQEVNYLMYQHHLPRSMHRNLSVQNANDLNILDKFNHFVVNYEHFEDFIKSLMKKFEDHPM